MELLISGSKKKVKNLWSHGEERLYIHIYVQI